MVLLFHIYLYTYYPQIIVYFEKRINIFHLLVYYIIIGNEVEQSVFFNADGVLHSIVRKTSLAKDFHALFQCHDARDDDGTETKYQEE